MRLNKALRIAEEVINSLAPYCERIAVAGSIRRKRPNPKDIEIVCIPKTTDILGIDDDNPLGLFNNENCLEPDNRSPLFIAEVRRLGEIVKGDPSNGKYVQITLKDSKETLDLFITKTDVWGLIYTIRTGSADYVKYLATEWVKKGFKSKDGVLTNKWGDRKSFYEEIDVFEFLKIPFPEPEKREL